MNASETTQVIGWFKTLPIYLDLDHFNIYFNVYGGCCKITDIIEQLRTMTMKRLLAMLFLLVPFSTAIAFTQCQGGFIDKGDSVSDVYAKCGKPEFAYESSGNGSEDRTESWSYERKKGGTATIYIEDGKVIGIDESIDKKHSPFTGFSR